MVAKLPCRDAALHYASTFGWKLFPARMEEGKKFSWLSAAYAPGGENWGMTSDLDQLQSNFNNPRWRQKCGVGIPTGAVNGIFVLETDTVEGHEVDGASALRQLVDKYGGTLPPTLMAESPSGSVHRYFNHPGNGARLRSCTLVHGVDVKADGGMVVAPPSVRSDGAYRWLNDHPIADAPEWLLGMLCDVAPSAGNGSGSIWDHVNEPAQRSVITIADINAALAVIPNDETVLWEEWNKIGMAIWRSDASGAGFAAFDAWSQKWPGYSAARTVERWLAYFKSPPSSITAASLLWRADQAAPEWRDRVVKVPVKEQAERELPVLRSLYAEELRERPRKSLEWIVKGFVLRKSLNGFFGDGGVGKDYLMMQLAVAMTSNSKWLGKTVAQGKVLYFASEDDEEELRRRQYAIEKHLGIVSDPKTFKIVPMFGEDAILGVHDTKLGVVRPTPLYEAVCKMIEEFKPDLVIVGNRVNIFAVNQNDDASARQCIGLLNAICKNYGVSVIMPSHVSLGGAQSGSGTSGSVQWNNGIRMRLYLSFPKPEEGEPENTTIRDLEVKKSNYSTKGDILRVEWVFNAPDGNGAEEGGVFVCDQVEEVVVVPEEGETPEQIKRRKEAERDARDDVEFLRTFDRNFSRGSFVSAAPTSHTFAPHIFATKDAECALRGKANKSRLLAAMNRLLARNIIVSVQWDYQSKDKWRLERVGLRVVK